MLTIEELAAFAIVLGTIPFIVMSLSYFLAPKRILPRKNEYVKFALVFLSAFLVLSTISIMVWTIPLEHDSPEQVTHVLLTLAAWFFPLLFAAYMIYKFKTVERNRHVGFFLFWAALASLPLALGFLYGMIVE